MPQRAPIAILTGDLVGSRQVPSGTVEDAMRLLHQTARDIGAWFGGDESRFTRFRGDGWQIYVPEAGVGLRAALCMIARLHGSGLAIATRVGIGIGTADSLGSDSLADAHGAAFEAAGQALEHSGRLHRLAITGERVTPLHSIVVRLIDERIGRWTKQQAEAVAHYLHPDNPTLSEIAARLGITPQAVSYRLNGAGATVLRLALRDWEMDCEEQF